MSTTQPICRGARWAASLLALSLAGCQTPAARQADERLAAYYTQRRLSQLEANSRMWVEAEQQRPPRLKAALESIPPDLARSAAWQKANLADAERRLSHDVERWNSRTAPGGEYERELRRLFSGNPGAIPGTGIRLFY